MSGWSVAIVAVALVLLPIAAVSFLAHHRVLVAHSLTDALTGIGNRPAKRSPVAPASSRCATPPPP